MARIASRLVFLPSFLLVTGQPSFAGQSTEGASSLYQGRPEWRWHDFEVNGYRSVSRDAILEHIPLERGTPYATDFEQWAEWQEDLINAFDFHHVFVSAVRFPDQKAYLTIDVVERDEADRVDFRDAPTGHVEAPPDVFALGRQLEALKDSLFNQGRPLRESVAKGGYLDFDNPEAHRLAQRLVEITAAHRATLVRIIKEDADGYNKRARAARLLNWAGDIEQSIIDVHRLVDDPDMTVRNNITRFMVHYIDQVDSLETAEAITRSMYVQLRRPSHPDRNKSIYALLHLARANVQVRPFMLDLAGATIQRVADQSILSNVQDPALELIELLQATGASTTRPDAETN